MTEPEIVTQVATPDPVIIRALPADPPLVVTVVVPGPGGPPGPPGSGPGGEPDVPNLTLLFENKLV